MIKTLLVATGNSGKLAEFRALLEPYAAQVIGMQEAGLQSPEETATTFVENALLKARHAAAATGLAVLADDSGLVVPALGGAPGIHSARYAGPKATDQANNDQLIAALKTLQGPYQAYYHASLVLLRAADDPVPIIAQANWFGEIVLQPAGTQGFGYDPYFWLPEYQCTAAELDPELKNRISHRAKALEILLAEVQRQVF